MEFVIFKNDIGIRKEINDIRKGYRRGFNRKKSVQEKTNTLGNKYIYVSIKICVKILQFNSFSFYEKQFQIHILVNRFKNFKFEMNFCM